MLELVRLGGVIAASDKLGTMQRQTWNIPRSASVEEMQQKDWSRAARSLNLSRLEQGRILQAINQSRPFLRRDQCDLVLQVSI
jgi:hypothetical protein